MNAIKQHLVHGIRWTPVQSLSDGTLMAHAYTVDNPHNPVVEAQLPKGSTEAEVFDAIRIALCERYRQHLDTSIKNDRGDVL